MIPRIIHQIWIRPLPEKAPIWRSLEMPEPWRESVASWQRHHPGWAYRLWNDEEIEALLRRRSPAFWDFYQSLPYTVCRADAARFFILREFGGLYSDLDVLCNRPVDDLLEHDVVLPRTEPVGVSNDFMMARPGSVLMDAVVRGLPANFRLWHRWFVPRYLQVLAGTASLYLTWRLWRHRGPERIHLLPAELYSSGDPERAYVLHIEGNTWHGNDSGPILWAYENRRALAALALVAAAGLFWLKGRAQGPRAPLED